ncbi:putative insecticidal toxin [Pseudomonas chlororaphis subsp. piscium]|uniref:Tc toxin subunit A-related protein n=1 Tax=Pseudomonas chlororaphis TaxID=587753 RepID=UPI000F6C6272|nr:neuraminidase-like domain-containing protein [Pseudomonas chlororaphis]AZC51707.1 putative insecticidal toxin [Pseudomonas chlororaphis subsp. piscium]
MYDVEKTLEKLNKSKKMDGGDRLITLSDIMMRSFTEFKELAGNSLSWGEKHFLYQQAQEALKENRMVESRILSRANPQLTNAVRLGIRQSSMRRSYDDFFGGRSSKFVKPGSVASMFSPAGYLTELYREAKNLHAATSEYNLDKRRPDLAFLLLSQGNMDDELSTLSLSNELLLNNIQAMEGKDYDGVLEMLSTYNQTGMTPCHLPYETVRHAFLLQDTGFSTQASEAEVENITDNTSLLAIQANISPALYRILLEEVTAASSKKLFLDNFGEKANIELFRDVSYLSSYYDVPVETLLEIDCYIRGDGSIRPGVILGQPADNFDSHLDFYNIELIKDDVWRAVIGFNKRGGNTSVKVVDKISSPDDRRLASIAGPTLPGKNYETSSFHLPEADSEKAFTMYVLRYEEDNGSAIMHPLSDAKFDNGLAQYYTSILKINKIIRLHKATGYSPTDVRLIVESVYQDLRVDHSTVCRLLDVNQVVNAYHVSVADALVLCTADISLYTPKHGGSKFSSLFNTPLMNGKEFFADDAKLDLMPGASNDYFRLGVLMRAFRVNESELHAMWKLACGNKSEAFTCSLRNLSTLYRVRLLADVHQMTVNELALLLSVSPYVSSGVGRLSDADQARLLSFLRRYTQWLNTWGWTVSDLYLMATDSYSTTLSPDIESLLTTLKDGLASQDLSQLNELGIIHAAAPFISAATQLDSAELASAVLQWLDQLKPQGLTVKKFLALVISDHFIAGETAKLVSFCQVMGQLALIVRSLRLTAGEISLAVTQPGKLLAGAKTLPHDIATIRALARFRSWLQQCGASATEILSALGSGTLTPVQLAQAMTLDEQMVIQGLAQHDRNALIFSGWMAIDVTLQWVDMATALSITPTGVAALMNLKYIEPTRQPSYSDWAAVSHTLQSGLNSQQAMQLQATLDEMLSAAVSAYAIKNLTPSWVTDRDKLYSWLLLDNQVSAQVKTTRLAEAISSVQLYVNRALSGLEQGERAGVVKSRRFFIDWDSYNKRYSTWAGVSQLVYYPENYIDPTLRIGQTGMMDEMLQTLSQSQLTSDTVENAFKTYMTRFEEIANLEIISGYHDSTLPLSGSTYLIGKSSIGDYYWRTAEMGKMSGGKLPANAWSEWKKVATAATPVNNLIRPVVFQSRLYVFWIEVSDVAGFSVDKKAEEKKETQLKYSHIQHDGTWSAPVNYSWGKSSLSKMASPRLYCSQSQGEGCILAVIYDAMDEESAVPTVFSGVQISSDGGVSDVNGLDDILRFIRVQLGDKANIMMNSPYIGGGRDDVLVSVVDSSSGYGASMSIDVALHDVKAKILYSENNVELEFALAECVFAYNFTGRQVEMINKVGSMGDVFYLPKSKEITPTDNEFMQCVASNKGVFIQTTVRALSRKGSVDGIDYGAGDPAGFGEGGSSIIRLGSGVSAPPREAALRCSPNGTSLYFHTFTDFNEVVDTRLDVANVGVSAFYRGAGLGVFNATKRNEYTFQKTSFSFEGVKYKIPLADFSNSADGSVIVESSFGYIAAGFPFGPLRTLRLTRVMENKLPVIPLIRVSNGAQYLQYGVFRIRVNTLFAKKLVARANRGLSAVLSMETQQLQEPKLGKGFYASFVLPPYDKNIHGDSPQFTLNLKSVVDNNVNVVYSGMLASHTLSVKLFVPLDDRPLNDNYAAKVFLSTDKQGDVEWDGAYFQYTDSTQTTVKIHSSSNISMFENVVILADLTEPMDFSGANALYFWEMFYYVPMMVFRRLLQESNFSEATQWIKYVWSPEGYLVDGQPAIYQWNVRPLEEDITWNSNPLDSVDPDAVAQADPMHYKVATFIGMLDLLIARGDAAYRQLERDTLNEAKMWYVQALAMLGEEPYLPEDNSWTNPALSKAADQTRQTHSMQALEAVRWQTVESESYTGNSLTDVFLPQQNEKLKGYWQTLAQRLYNLRHNLSIDGQPLSLPIYARPIDPSALLSAVVNTSQGSSSALSNAVMPLYRFPVMLENARSMVGQLTQFGNALLGISERQDAETLSELLQTQGSELMLQSIILQEKTLAEIDADRTALEQSRRGAESRLDSYASLYDENVSSIETRLMDLYTSSSSVAAGAHALFMAGAALDLVPNIYGLATGGARLGALSNALAIGTQTSSDVMRITADRLGQSEAYRRRRQEWEVQRNNAESEVKQIDASLAALAIRREAAVLQKTYLETQQSQVQAQLTFLQNKFTSKALYNWLRGKLAAIYSQFYDLTVSRCLMAQEAYKWALGTDSASFIRPGAWQGTYSGLMAGETLMLNLVQMEQAYLQKNQREKEVMRTVCLSDVYAGLSDGKFLLADKVTELVAAGKGSAGSDENGLKVENKQLLATLKLSDLKIREDYPNLPGNIRRIKQISVTLPALVGPYQDVRAVLSYGGSVVLPQGCNAVAVSHGMNDSGQFQLDFNDSRWLPFEGVPVDDGGTLTLSFPEADSKQQALLLSLTDIILHIRYTIIS